MREDSAAAGCDWVEGLRLTSPSTALTAVDQNSVEKGGISIDQQQLFRDDFNPHHSNCSLIKWNKFSLCIQSTMPLSNLLYHPTKLILGSR